MKYRLLFVMLFVTSLSFSQKSNQVKVYYGFADSDYTQIEEENLGGSSYTFNRFYINEIGVEYNRKIGKNFRLETGLNYFSSKVNVFVYPPPFLHHKPIIKGGENIIKKEYEGGRYIDKDKVQILTIPISLITEFWNYFYVNSGILIDFQTNQSKYIDSQSGIGVVVGVGAKYNYKEFTFFVTPELRVRRLVGFKKIIDPGYLSHFGAKIGIGYNF